MFVLCARTHPASSKLSNAIDMKKDVINIYGKFIDRRVQNPIELTNDNACLVSLRNDIQSIRNDTHKPVHRSTLQRQFILRVWVFLIIPNRNFRLTNFQHFSCCHFIHFINVFFTNAIQMITASVF